MDKKDEIQKIFESTIPKDTENFVFDYDYIIERSREYNTTIRQKLIAVKTENGNIHVDYPYDEEYHYSQKSYYRVFHMIIEKFKLWLVEKKLSLPDMMMFFESKAMEYTLDSRKYPMWFMSTVQKDTLIFPFYIVLFHFSTNIENEVEFLNFDNFKELLITNSVKSWEEKLDIAQFKGTLNTFNVHNLRENINHQAQYKDRILIDTDSEIFQPMWEASKYKFVLNIPGTNPWSYREVFIPYLRSVMIAIEVHGYNLDGEFLHGRTISAFQGFYDRLKMKKFIFKHYHWKGRKERQIAMKKHRKQIYSLIAFIERTMDFYLSHPEIAKKEIDHNFNVMLDLNEERIYEYIYSCFMTNYKIVNNSHNRLPPGDL